LFLKGLIYGLAVIGLNTLVLSLTMKYFVARAARFKALTFFLFYVLRYAILGALIYLLLTQKWGSPIGLLAGITLGLVGFMAFRRSV
jgi:hypothetical protein